MIGPKKIFAPRNRGLLLDLTVFVAQLLVLRATAKIALSFAHQAEEDNFAKFNIGLFLVGLTVLTFFLPPAQLGPVIPLIYMLVFGSLLLNGSLFSDLPWATAGLLWLAPFGVLIGPPASSAGGNRNLRLLLRGLIVLAIVGLAFVALFLISPQLKIDSRATTRAFSASASPQ